MKERKKIIELADKYENEAFISNDPIRFLHCMPCTSLIQDIEIIAVFSQWLAYGKRSIFLHAIGDIVRITGNNTYYYILSRDWERFQNDYSVLYRFQTYNHFYNLCSKLYRVYIRYESLEDALNFVMKSENFKYYHQGLGFLLGDSDVSQTLIPNHKSTSPCKRLNMMLRWLVRKSKVDLGVWKSISKKKLLVPLDTHVINSAYEMGIITSKTENFSNCLAVTNLGSKCFEKDPARIDFALYGFGINK